MTEASGPLERPASLAVEQSAEPMRVVIIGLTITSSWGNGHATTFRGLVRELARRGHDVLFLEHDKPWYAGNRDLPNPPYGRTELYQSVPDLKNRFLGDVREADVVIVGSYVPEGVGVGEWVTATAGGVTAFYDIDTPVTLAKLARQDHEYLTPSLIPRYNLYLSFSGGPTLERLEQQFGSPAARAFYCSVDPELYYPEPQEKAWDLGYLGTYSPDRQPPLETLLLEPARRWVEGRFVVAGPQYPAAVDWGRVQRIEHLPPSAHRRFYCQQRWTLNITRADMIRAGFSPSVRLFEAAACGVPIISDEWAGMEAVLVPGREICCVDTADEVIEVVRDTSDRDRQLIADRAREKVLTAHTAAHRARQFEHYVDEVRMRASTGAFR